MPEMHSGTTTVMTNSKNHCLGVNLVKRLFQIAFASFSLLAVLTPWARAQDAQFDLAPEGRVLDCFSAGDGSDPSAHVTVTRGELNDVLTLHAEHLKPNLAFDMFTIQNSNLLADGSADPNFHNFGLAWYQSDLQADDNGVADVTIQTILLDQIFGFDPAVGLPPTNTFHVGFWFNNPQDAAPCGFDPTHPTPFNGEHKAGPAAMISLPDARTKLGPLCTNPVQASVSSFICHP
jgi:hypothetical protein